MLDNNDAAAYTNYSDIYEIKYGRLVRLVKETEETESIDYVKTMSEVNSLVYDLITGDQSRSEMVVENSSAESPQCYICRALEEIGRETMASKVESERVLLEAIAISEGRFDEEHGASFHFRVELAVLYRDWSCREDSDSVALLVRIALLASRKATAGNGADLLSELLNSPGSNEAIRCMWLQGPAWESSLATSSHQLSTLSIQGETIRDSPRNIWGMIVVIIKHFGFFHEDIVVELAPLLDSILRQGPESVDGSSYFWIATFFLAIHELWGLLFNSRYLISSTANRYSLPGSITLEASLGQLRIDPYRLESSEEIAGNGEGVSNSGGKDEPSISKDHARFEDISKIEGSLENLDQLCLVLAELSLSALEKSDRSEAFALPPEIIQPSGMFDTLCNAARLGNSSLIKQLGTHFGNSEFEGTIHLTDLLNLDGEVREWGLDEAPLCLAARAGHQLTVEALISAGADPDGPAECDESPIFLAADAGHDEIVGLLIKRGVLSGFAPLNNKVLASIINSSDQEVLENWLRTVSDDRNYLLDLLFAIALIGDMEKYDLLGPVSERITEHYRLTENGTPKLGRPMLRSILDVWDRSELYDFLVYEDECGRGLELVLNAVTGVHIEQQARQILKTALFGSDTELNEMLRPGKSSDPDQPVLHTLVSRNAPNALGVFLKLGPNTEASDKEGNTALHIAAARNRIDCARRLLEHGIDVDVENMRGKTALQIAIRAGHTKISEEIRSFSHVSTSDEEDDLVI
jgi:hypothetical protein